VGSLGAEARHERHLITGQAEQQPLAIHLDQREKPLGSEIAARDDVDCVPAGQALVTALELAHVLAARPSRALQLMKQAVDLALDTTEDDAARELQEQRVGQGPAGSP